LITPLFIQQEIREILEPETDEVTDTILKDIAYQQQLHPEYDR